MLCGRSYVQAGPQHNMGCVYLLREPSGERLVLASGGFCLLIAAESSHAILLRVSFCGHVAVGIRVTYELLGVFVSTHRPHWEGASSTVTSCHACHPELTTSRVCRYI